MRERSSPKRYEEGEQGGLRERSEDVAHSYQFNDDDGRCGAGKVCRKRPEASGVSGREQDVADTERVRQQRQGQRIDTGNQAQNREGQAGDAVNERERGERQTESPLGSLAYDVPDKLVRWSEVEAQVGRVTNETEHRADKLKALGNAQVPLQAAAAFSILWKMMEVANAKN